MITQSSTLAATRGAVTVPRVRSILVLAVLSLAIFASSAQAHTGSATATCESVTFQWTKFAASGPGLNNVNWKIVFIPTGGAAATTTGTESFDKAYHSLKVTIPGGNGTLVASSNWTQTRDGNRGSFSKNLTISDCVVVVPSPPMPPTLPPPPPPVPPVTPASPALSTTPNEQTTTPNEQTTTPNEQTPIPSQLVKGACVPSPVVLRGLSSKVRTAVSVHVTAIGVKSVTFYLDGRKLKTVTQSKNQRYSLKVSARGLGYGRHRLQVKVTMRNATCATAAASRAFVKVKPTIIRRPQFTG
jgi:Bacterial Ig domain